MIYLDNAATTKPYPEAVAHYATVCSEYFNPAALYSSAVDCARKIATCKMNTLKYLRAADDDDLYFTSGGTESDNWALFGTKKQKGGRIIVSEGEHDAVINPAKELSAQGYDVVFAPINPDGSVNEAEFVKLLTPAVTLVSIMHASNETGAVNDIKRLVNLVKTRCPKALFHSDGVQAVGKIAVNLRALGVDLYSISAHKLHGLKGIGALYVKKGVSLKPIIYGGGQQKGMRSGTENLPMVSSFAFSLSKSCAEIETSSAECQKYTAMLRQGILEGLPTTKIITPENCALPNVLTVAFDGIRGEVLLHALEKQGIVVGIGSACSSHHESRFKRLLDLDNSHRDGIVRFSVSRFTTEEEIEQTIVAVCDSALKLADYAQK